ncbi:MAG: cysteine synthase family protein [Bdellovibrionales bacterium]|nr:cysteine synthase family protein [Bdellovibrionales bacterium]
MNFQPIIAQNVEELIGRTPLLRLQDSLRDIPAGEWLRAKIPGVATGTVKSELLAKVEFFNPGGSVKDRIALAIVNSAEKSGALKPGGTIVEATSGNTGAGLAIVAAVRGYKTIFVMPDKMSAEKINALRAFGAKVVVTPTAVEPTHPEYYCNVAKRIADETPGAFLANQYFSPDNPRAHYETTGPEIWAQCEGKIDVLFAGIGTGGTLSGTAKFLKEKNPKIRIVAVDPVGSIYAGMIREGKPSPAGSYLVEGVGEDMIPGTIDLKLMNDCVTVNDRESFAATRMLAQKEGLLVGGSCGSAYYGAVQYLRWVEATEGRTLRGVVILPDSGSRYLSKIFNPNWLNEKNVGAEWDKLSLGGKLQYLDSAKRIEGVE